MIFLMHSSYRNSLCSHGLIRIVEKFPQVPTRDVSQKENKKVPTRKSNVFLKKSILLLLLYLWFFFRRQVYRSFYFSKLSVQLLKRSNLFSKSFRNFWLNAWNGRFFLVLGSTLSLNEAANFQLINENIWGKLCSSFYLSNVQNSGETRLWQ